MTETKSGGVMTEQTPKPLDDILAAVRSTLLPSPDDALVRALVETIEARIEQDRAENAALRARVAVEEELHLKTLQRAEKAEARVVELEREFRDFIKGIPHSKDCERGCRCGLDDAYRVIGSEA